MKFTRNQLIIIGGAALLVVVILLVFVGFVPGRKKVSEAEKVTGTLEFWGVFDEPAAYAAALTSFRGVYPNLAVNYRFWRTEADYERAVLDALAAGKGPDIFMIKNTALLRDSNKLAAVPQAKLSLLALRNLYPQVVESDFVLNGAIYGLPLFVDTLSLFYNQDILNAAAVTVPPKTWIEFEELVPRLTRRNGDVITRAAAAIGGSLKSVNQADDILAALMFQSGTEMVGSDLRRATFSSTPGLNALNFYVKFANPNQMVYTWNDSFPNDFSAFGRGEVAMIFEYASALPKIKSQNPRLNFGVAPFPQTGLTERAATRADYWGYVVARQSKRAALAWDFVIHLTTKEANAKSYFEATKKPPALRSLIEKNLNDPDLTAFVRQTLVARSFREPDPPAVRTIFSELIEKMNAGGAPTVLLKEAEDKVTRLMQERQ